jgi:hypothetical protein
MRFSEKYKSFEDWLKHFEGSKTYKNRIVKLHALHPKASLSQLRGHPSKKEKPLKPKPAYKKPWNQLTRKQKKTRKTALKVLSNVREGKSLNKAAKDLKTTPSTVIKNTGAFTKKNGRWVVKDRDKVPRVMSIFEEGGKTWVEINDSKIASRIGEYNNAVKKYIDTGDTSGLAEFKGESFVDAKGRKHVFITDTVELDATFEELDEGDFISVYD